MPSLQTIHQPSETLHLHNTNSKLGFCLESSFHHSYPSTYTPQTYPLLKQHNSKPMQTTSLHSNMLTAKAHIQPYLHNNATSKVGPGKTISNSTQTVLIILQNITLNLQINNNALDIHTHTNILNLTLDRKFTYDKHTNKISKNIPIFKVLFSNKGCPRGCYCQHQSYNKANARVYLHHVVTYCIHNKHHKT